MNEVKTEEIADMISASVKDGEATIATEFIRLKKLNPLIVLDKQFIEQYISNYKKDLEQLENVYNSL